MIGTCRHGNQEGACPPCAWTEAKAAKGQADEVVRLRARVEELLAFVADVEELTEPRMEGDGYHCLVCQACLVSSLTESGIDHLERCLYDRARRLTATPGAQAGEGETDG